MIRSIILFKRKKFWNQELQMYSPLDKEDKGKAPDNIKFGLVDTNSYSKFNNELFRGIYLIGRTQVSKTNGKALCSTYRTQVPTG